MGEINQLDVELVKRKENSEVDETLIEQRKNRKLKVGQATKDIFKMQRALKDGFINDLEDKEERVQDKDGYVLDSASRGKLH